VRTIVGVRSCDCGIQGPENLILTLAHELQAHGVRYVIVNLWDGDPPTVELHEEAQRRGLESYVVATDWDFDPMLLPRLASQLRRLSPDVIHTHDFKSDMTVMVANAAVRAPLITSFYGRLAINSFFLKLEDWIRLVAFRFFRRVMPNSRLQRSELLRWRVPTSKIEMLPSFVDTRQIRPPSAAERQAARERLGVAPGQPVLATVARLAPNKGHRYMIEALAGVRKTFPDVLYLVPGEGDQEWHGDGGLRGELVRQTQALGLEQHVRFLGYYPDVQTILHAADMLVSPSLREGMQVSLLEGMAAGLPVVATDIGGTPDAVANGVTGVLVPPTDPAALGTAVVAMLNDPARMHRMGAAGRQRVETLFDTRVVAARVLHICEDVVAGRAAQETPA
jgi:glycosyltransferase involved in cell wall biosynthesis